MVAGICVEETQRIVSYGGIDNLIDAGEREGILWASLVEVFEINTKALGFVLLWYHYQIC